MNFSLNIRGKLLSLAEPKVMAIVNLTHDSFYAESRVDDSGILDQASVFIEEGADILDLGAFSSRPGSHEISEKEELDKLLPAIDTILDKFPETIISVDTYRASVAKKVIEAGACLINDISGGDMDQNMFETIANLNVPYIMMHMQGSPNSMQNSPSYHNDNPAFEIVKILSEKTRILKQMGVRDFLVDPGFGFGKTIDHNFQILNHLDHFNMLDCPILVGLSRKSMIYKTIDTTPEGALNGTSICHAIALQKGAHILRVHDVKEAKEAISLHQKLKQNY
jgi:dihydropteroate synthase